MINSKRQNYLVPTIYLRYYLLAFPQLAIDIDIRAQRDWKRVVSAD